MRSCCLVSLRSGDEERRAFEDMFQGMDVDNRRCIRFGEFASYVQQHRDTHTCKAAAAGGASPPAAEGLPQLQAGRARAAGLLHAVAGEVEASHASYAGAAKAAPRERQRQREQPAASAAWRGLR